MECPFCADTVKDEAIVCKHCSRDLRLVRPYVLEIQDLVRELDGLRRDLDRVNARLNRVQFPLRYIAIHLLAYVLPPALLLLLAHALVTIVLDVSPLYLRIASLIIPIPFGLATYAVQKLSFRGVFVLAFLTAALAVFSMLTVTGLHDKVAILPQSLLEWREVAEYMASIMLAFWTGSILGVLIFTTLPDLMAQGGRPNAAAFRMARLLGQHVGEEQLRRRARIIQDLMRTVGPLAGIAATALGSIYAGLKGFFGI